MSSLCFRINTAVNLHIMITVTTGITILLPCVSFTNVSGADHHCISFSLCVHAGHTTIQAWHQEQHLQALHVGGGSCLCLHCLLLLLRGVRRLLGLWKPSGKQHHAFCCSPHMVDCSCQHAGCCPRFWQLSGNSLLLLLLLQLLNFNRPCCVASVRCSLTATM